MKKIYTIRLIVSLCLVLAVLGLYVARLVQFQLIDGESYATRNEQTYTTTVSIPAARGEILDRYGRALAVNKQVYTLTFDMAYLPDDRINEIILKTVQLLERMDEEWVDVLPISMTEPFVFLEGQDTLIESIKTKYRLNSWATAEDVIAAMSETFDTGEFTPDEQRLIDSVRYSMDIYGFNVKNPYTVAEDISTETVMLFEENSFLLPGVSVQEAAIRDYPNGTIAPHIIGTVSPIYADEYEELAKEGYAMNDKIGRSGVEAVYEDYLRGVAGEKVITFDTSGNVVKEEVTREPVAGGTVYTTIDSRMQSFVQTALQNRIAEIVAAATEDGPGYDAFAGAVVVEQVKTGELLTAATYPSYDLETYYTDYAALIADETKPLWNRALYGTYAPGSTFKPAVSLAALAEGIVTNSTTVDCEGTYTYYEDYQPGCMSVHGLTNLRKALCYSCNIYYYEVGRLLGIDSIDKYANRLGLGVKTGIEIGEAEGIIASPEYKAQLLQTWNPGDVIQAAIGQSDSEVTPIQLAAYASTLANDGIRYRTSIVKCVKSYDYTSDLYTHVPIVEDDLSEYADAFAAIEEGMKASAQEGTVASYFKDYRVEIATKTGTPQTGQSEKSNNATFIAYAPANDPEIAIAIVIEQGGHGFYIAPLMKDIMNYYFDMIDDSSESINTLLE